jgi:hypothetical protein
MHLLGSINKVNTMWVDLSRFLEDKTVTHLPPEITMTKMNRVTHEIATADEVRMNVEAAEEVDLGLLMAKRNEARSPIPVTRSLHRAKDVALVRQVIEIITALVGSVRHLNFFYFKS